jgi:hypothetical protein
MDLIVCRKSAGVGCGDALPRNHDGGRDARLHRTADAEGPVLRRALLSKSRTPRDSAVSADQWVVIAIPGTNLLGRLRR